MTGRLIPYWEIRSRVAVAKLSLPHRICVPLMTRMITPDVRDDGQILFMSVIVIGLLPLNVPVEVVFTGVSDVSRVPGLAHVPFRTWTV